MTIQEYSTLMGYEETCPEEEYETANFIYVMAGEMSKQKFCKEYKQVGSIPLVLELAESANKSKKAYRYKEANECTIVHALLREADEIREGGMEASAGAIDMIAAKLIGRKGCIKWKLSRGYALSETDNEYINDNLR